MSTTEPSRGHAQSKTARQQLIIELLTGCEISSQSRLAEMLGGRGIEVTQATLSRDLVELRAEKVRGSDGALVYQVPPDGGEIRSPRFPGTTEQFEARLPRLIEELLASAEAADTQLVLRTPPGAAQFLASSIDRSVIPGVLGTIAGDDTILLITRDAEVASHLASRFLDLAEGRRPAPPTTADGPDPDRPLT